MQKYMYRCHGSPLELYKVYRRGALSFLQMALLVKVDAIKKALLLPPTVSYL